MTKPISGNRSSLAAVENFLSNSLPSVIALEHILADRLLYMCIEEYKFA